jgi:dTDP-4-dehydrorhamnose reductase
LNCLVIGYGLLGKKLAEKLQEKGIQFSVASDDIGAEIGVKLDITEKKAVASVFEKEKPGVVFLTAALSNVDGCEKNREKTFKVNVEGTKNVAKACKSNNCLLVFYSSDFVFDGKKGSYTEQDKPNPLNVYGASKLEAENAIKEILSNYIIIRTSTLYGAFESGKKPESKKGSFVQWVYESLKQGKQISVVTDQTTCPTLVDDLAAVSIALVEKKQGGIFNVAGKTALSRARFAEKIAERFGLQQGLIKPISSRELGQAAKRPANSSLSMKKLNGVGISTKSVAEGLALLSEI